MTPKPNDQKMLAQRLLVSIGDPNGIGPEIAVKAAIAMADQPALRPVIVGGRAVLEHWAHRLQTTLLTDPQTWGGGGIDVDLLNPSDDVDLAPGKVCAQAGTATVAALKKALELVQSGVGRAIVGCPHSETAINASGRAFSGYPGLIAELTGQPDDQVFLMLVSDDLRIIHATLHESVPTAVSRLSPELVERAALQGVETLQKMGIEAPSVGLFGINPHAGEDGLFGTEDEHITKVAAARLRKKGVSVYGPEGADVMLQRRQADLYVAMLHDQGHIPIKLLAGRSASAFTVGARVVFSSVGHGAAFDIAGRGVADPSTVIRTIKRLGGEQ